MTPELTARRQHAINLRPPVQQRVLHLVRSQRNSPLGQRVMRNPHLLSAVVAHPDLGVDGVGVGLVLAEAGYQLPRLGGRLHHQDTLVSGSGRTPRP
ncbi:MAG TPA: hypothetical protein VE462_07400 [Propionibacteriaceae bacterium]|nr:hypothetical protein [Propionibacteriaceae bacterium]